MAKTIGYAEDAGTVDVAMQQKIEKNNTPAPISTSAQTGMSTGAMFAWGLGGLAALVIIAVVVKKIIKK